MYERHGMTGTREHKSWIAMKKRCLNPRNRDYKHYGGKGITVCAQWRNSFLEFLRDIGQAPTRKHTLERISNRKGYRPGNVRWATQAEQLLNTSRSNKLTLNGKTLTLGEWAKETGIKRPTLSNRLNAYGWSVRRALTTPTRPKL